MRSKAIFYPKTVGIELVRGCNFACRMCPVTAHARQHADEPLQFMDLHLLRHIVADIDRWPTIQDIWFFHFGEPLLHPEFRRCMEILNESEVARKAVVQQYTNASLLNGERADAILEVPIIKRLVASFDGFGDRDSYEALRGSHYQRVLENIREFAIRAKASRPDLQLAVETILPAQSQVAGLEVLPPYLAHAALNELFVPLSVEVATRSLHNYSGNDNLQIAGSWPEHRFGGCPFVEADSVYLTVDGRAQPCCAVYDPDFNIGRIQEEDFGSLLNGERMSALRPRLRLDRRASLPYCRNCSIFLGGTLNDADLRRFWIERDDAGAVDETEVRDYLFGSLFPTRHRIRRLDLGSASVAQPGFVAVDRYPLPGVDVATDFDAGLPFRDSSFDLVYASHALEHSADLPSLMREIYRVARDRAQVCIVAPYFFTSVNLSNPYHRQVFTEETPRFWTTARSGEMTEASHCPQAPFWGLGGSDMSDPGMDFRCLRMGFFYFAEYQNLPEDELRRLRQSQLNVCDQIVYHLLVVKSPLCEGELEELMRTMQYYQPPYVTIRAQQERLRALEAEAGRQATAEADQARAEAVVALQRREENLARGMEELRASEQASREILERRLAAEEEIARASSRLSSAMAVIRRLETELSGLTNCKLVRWLCRMRPGQDWQGQLSSGFQQLLDDSFVFGAARHGFVLRPSEPLSTAPFLPYEVMLDRPGWCGVSVAPLIDIPGGAGEIGIEIVSPEQQVIRHVRAGLAEVKEGEPLTFSFRPILDSNKGRFELRIFVQGADTDVRALEWRRPTFAGLRPARRKPFCAFRFQH